MIATGQSGAALIVGLVLMLVLTVLGISGMNTVSVELTMANNLAAEHEAFQAAESGIDVAIGSRDFTTRGSVSVPAMPLGDGGYSAQTTTQCVATTPVPDAAFSMGTAAGSMRAFHFATTSIGTGPRGASATLNQEFYVVGPAGAAC